MDLVQPDAHVTPEEYFETERSGKGRHEYMFGKLVKVPGGPPRHSLIAANTCIAFGKKLAGSNSRVFVSSLRVCLDEPTSFYVYPDVTVVEGEIKCLPDRDETVTNPKLAAEVLSPASRDVELGGKARMYLRVASLTDLLMIDQDRIAVEHWVRRSGDSWDVATLTDPNAVIRIESLNCEIPVTEIYASCV